MSLAEGEERTRHLGTLKEGASAEVSFELLSDGEGPLVVEDVHPSCGCTVAGVWVQHGADEWRPYEMGTAIPTGTRWRVDTKLYTAGKLGGVGVPIMIRSNAETAPSLRIEAEVEPLLEILPGRRIDFGQVDRATGAERVLDVTTTSGDPVLLTPGTLPAGLSLELTPTDPDDEGRSSRWTARLGVASDIPVADRNFTCAIVTDFELTDPKHPAEDGSPQYLSAVLVAQVKGAVELQPPFVSFGKVRPGEVGTKSVRMVSRDGAPLDANASIAIEDPSGEPFEHAESFRATLAAVEEAGDVLELELELLGLPEGSEGSFLGRVRVEGAHPEQPDSSLRFSVVCGD